MSANQSNLELTLHRLLAEKSAKAVAEAIGSDDTHISRFRSGERGMRINQLGAFFSALGMKVVAVSDVTVDPEYLDALEQLSRRGIGIRER